MVIFSCLLLRCIILLSQPWIPEDNVGSGLPEIWYTSFLEPCAGDSQLKFIFSVWKSCDYWARSSEQSGARCRDFLQQSSRGLLLSRDWGNSRSCPTLCAIQINSLCLQSNQCGLLHMALLLETTFRGNRGHVCRCHLKQKQADKSVVTQNRLLWLLAPFHSFSELVCFCRV